MPSSVTAPLLLATLTVLAASHTLARTRQLPWIQSRSAGSHTFQVVTTLAATSRKR